MEENEILIEKGLSLSYSDCEAEFTAISKAVQSAKKTECYIKGDHWQERAGWKGWRPESNTSSAVAKWTFIQTVFVAKNVIGGMIKRLKGAIAGHQPDFNLAPSDENASDAVRSDFTAMDDALNDWFTKKDVHEQIKKFVHNRTAHGKGCLRIHIPKGLLQKSGDNWQVPATDFKSALDFIYVTAHDIDEFTEGTDVDFGEKYSIVKLAGNKNPSDVNKTPPIVYEVCFVDKNKQTVIRTVKTGDTGNTGKAENSKTSPPFTIDLNGNPLCLIKGKYEEAVISPTMWLMQDAVNCAKTNEALAGNNINFPETTIIDASLPKESVLQPNGKYKEQEVLPSGWGVFRKLKSFTDTDSDGGEKGRTAQFHERKPADPEFHARIASNNTRDMHQEAGMLYIYLADSEYASGDAKIEAMADYLILLIDNKTELDVVGTWLGTTVTHLAMRFGNVKEEYKKNFTFTYSTKLTLGKLTVEERQLMLEEVKLLLRSPRSYQVIAGISDDPTTELKSIESWFNTLSDDEKQIIFGLMKQATPVNNPPNPNPPTTGNS